MMPPPTPTTGSPVHRAFLTRRWWVRTFRHFTLGQASAMSTTSRGRSSTTVCTTCLWIMHAVVARQRSASTPPAWKWAGGWPRLPNGGPAESRGIGWGHLTSTDLAHWVEQPPALAPPFLDIRSATLQPPGAIAQNYFTGSATVVNGQPRLLFPTVYSQPNVTQYFPDCTVGNKSFPWSNDTACWCDLQMAVPSNLSDPFLADWKIVATPFPHTIEYEGKPHNFVFEDPDQAFRDPHNPNRWLLIHDTFGPAGGVQSPELLAIEGDDWTSPTVISSAKSLGSFCPGHGGCCPAFLRKEQVGADVLYVCSNAYVIGDFDPQPGNDSSYGLTPTTDKKTFDGTVEGGGGISSFASKGFFDERSGRYLHWTWILDSFQNATCSTETIWGWEATASVTRRMWVDLETQSLMFYPVSELSSLRGAVLVDHSSQGVPVGSVQPLLCYFPGGPVLQGRTLDLELEVRFDSGNSLPQGKLVLTVFGAADGSESTQIIVDTAYNSGWSAVMPNVDLPCDASIVKEKGWCDGNCTKGMTLPACEDACNANTSCVGFAHLPTSGNGNNLCCQKRWVGSKISAGATSGVKPQVIESKLMSALVVDRTNSSAVPLLGPSNATVFAELPQKVGDATINLRVLLDRSVLEVYAMHGRAHITTRAYPSKPESSTQIGLGWLPKKTSGDESQEASLRPVVDVRAWQMQPAIERRVKSK
jgi:sucrose-6-phosphate hydrolase SacC (GH32 family)